MKTGHAIIYIWLLTTAFILPSGATGFSVAEYRQQLHDFNARVEQIKEDPEQARQFESEIPESVSVRDGSNEYTFNYEWLKTDLRYFQGAAIKTRGTFLQRIQDHLKELDREVEAYAQAAAATNADHQKLSQILSRREFRKVGGPTWWDIFWLKVQRWLSKFFSKHPISDSGATDFLHILVYVAVAGAFAVFAIWLKRRFGRPADDFSREIIPFAPSAKGWASWLADARASAQEGDWRNGVHLAYWAAISFLEEHGAWKPDRARTPREYLRILGTRKPQYPILSALTRKFEVTWYGRRDAQAADFAEALQQLEKLGCK